MKTRTLSRSTLVADIADALRQVIVSGEIQPGQFLPSQKDLAIRFGVGLSTIHEAIQVLCSVGLLLSHAGKGTWVREDALNGLIHPLEVTSRFGHLDLGMVAEARLVIETALTEFAAKRADEADIQRMQDALARMRETVDDEESFVAADIDFHMSVARAGGNELLHQVYWVARGLFTEAITEMVQSVNVRLESIELQARIADAIARHDVSATRDAAFAHMNYVTALVEKSTQNTAKDHHQAKLTE